LAGTAEASRFWQFVPKLGDCQKRERSILTKLLYQYRSERAFCFLTAVSVYPEKRTGSKPTFCSEAKQGKTGSEIWQNQVSAGNFPAFLLY